MICTQFTALEELYLSSSRVEFITAHAFENCLNLRMLSLENNNITTIQNMAFSHSPNLEFLDLNNNHISSLQNYPFNGTRLWYINLEGNDLWYIFPQWFSSVRDTLLLLDVANNDLTYLASDVFAELTNLVELEIGFNSLR